MSPILNRVAIVGAALAIASVVLHGEEPRRVTGRAWGHVVEQGQSLRSVASRFAIDPQTIAAANDIRVTTVLKPGQELRLDNHHIVPPDVEDGAIVINVPQRMLFFRSGADVLAFAVAVGSRGWRTPVGPFTIVEKEENPTWDVPPSIAAEARRKGKVLPAHVPPGPDNPLGKFWMRLSSGGVGVHGTNAPTSLYQAVTHGCIRVHPDDIAVLFPLVQVGTRGVVTYQPILVAADGTDVYLEAHRDVYGREAKGGAETAREIARAAGLTDRIDWVVADAVIAKREGIARAVTRR